MNYVLIFVPVFYACTNAQSQNIEDQSSTNVLQKSQSSLHDSKGVFKENITFESNDLQNRSEVVSTEESEDFSVKEEKPVPLENQDSPIVELPVDRKSIETAVSQKKEEIIQEALPKKPKEQKKVVLASTEKVDTKESVPISTELPPQKKEIKTELEHHIAEIEKQYAQITSLDMDFEQTIHNEAFDGVLTQSGTMHLMEPKYFLWEITFPLEQSYYFNGSQLRVWNPTTNQLIISEYNGEQGNVASLLQNLSSLSTKYNVRMKSKTTTRITLEMAPQKELGCTEMHLTFDAQTYDIVGLRSVCIDTGTAEIAFSNMRKNTRTEPSLFLWSPPKDAETIIAQELLHP